MQPTDKNVSAETRKIRQNIAKSFVQKTSIITTRIKPIKSIRQGFEKTYTEIKKEGITLKKIERSFIEIERNLKAFSIFTLALASLDKEEVTYKKAGRKKRDLTPQRVEEKVQPKKRNGLFGLVFRPKVKVRPRVKLKTKPRKIRKPIKASSRKKIANKKLRNALNRLRARIKQRLAKIRGIQRYRANVEAARAQRRIERLRFKEEARLARERLIKEQKIRTSQAESDSRRIRANADAEANKIRSNAQVDADQRIKQAETDAKRIRAESEQRARALIVDAENESRQRVAAANREVTAANEQAQRVNEEVKKLEARRQQAVNDTAEAQRVVREAREELKRIQKDTTIAETERERLSARQQQLIKENETIRVTLREEANRIEAERTRLQSQIVEAENRLNTLRGNAESLELSERRRIQNLVSGGDVATRPTIAPTPEQGRVSPRVEPPSRVATEAANRLANQTSLTRRDIQLIVGERNVTAVPSTRQVAALLRAPNAPPVKPVESVKRAQQIAVLLSKPPAIKVPQNILNRQQSMMLTNSAQKAISRLSISVVTTISKKLPAIGLLIGTGFTIKAAVVDKTKIGTALNAYATLTPSFIAALATIYPLTINEVYKDIFEIYPEYDPDPSWFNKLMEVHILLYDEVQSAIRKLEESWNKAYNDLNQKWKRDLDTISQRGFGAFVRQTFDTNKPGRRESSRLRREQDNLIRGSVIPSQSLSEAIVNAAQITGVDPKILHTISMIESSGGRFLSNSTSSARGPFQFILSTWAELTRRYPNYKNILDKGPNDFDASALAAALYTKQNSKILERNGIPLNAETIYAAHFLGPGSINNGAVALYKLLETNPDDPASKYFSSAAASNQNIFYRKVRGQQTPRSIREVVEVLREKVNMYAEVSRNAIQSVGQAQQIQQTSEVIQNNQPTAQQQKNNIVVNNNTVVLGAKRSSNPFSSQESYFS